MLKSLLVVVLLLTGCGQDNAADECRQLPGYEGCYPIPTDDNCTYLPGDNTCYN